VTGEEKLASVERQIRAARKGDVIVCPYCGEGNVETDNMPCCLPFANAAIAVLKRLDFEDTKDLYDRVSEMAARN
jgi:hypothetical protein